MHLEVLTAKPGFYYLATPFTDKRKTVENRRLKEANRIRDILISKGINVHAPVANTRQASKDYKLPTDHEFWWKHTLDFLNSAAGLIVVQMEGWLDSRGVIAERAYAEGKGIPIWFLSPTTLEVSDKPIQSSL